MSDLHGFWGDYGRGGRGGGGGGGGRRRRHHHHTHLGPQVFIVDQPEYDAEIVVADDPEPEPDQAGWNQSRAGFGADRGTADERLAAWREREKREIAAKLNMDEVTAGSAFGATDSGGSWKAAAAVAAGMGLYVLAPSNIPQRGLVALLATGGLWWFLGGKEAYAHGIGGAFGDLPMSGLAPVSGITKGSGGYYYQKLADGSIRIAAGPTGVGSIFKPGTLSYDSVKNDVKSWNPLGFDDGKASKTTGSDAVLHALVGKDAREAMRAKGAVLTAQGGGGYTYEKSPDGTIKITAGPKNVGHVYAADSTIAKSINAEVGDDWASSGIKTGGLISAFAEGTGTKEGDATKNVIEAFQKGGKGAGYTEAARAAGQVGPGIVHAASDFIAAHKDSQKALIRKLATAKSKCKHYRAKKNVKKYTLWCHRAEMYKQMLAKLQAGESLSPADEASTGESAGVTSALPSWLIPVGAVAGIGGVLLLAFRK